MPDANTPFTAKTRSVLGGLRIPVFGGRVDRWEFDADGNAIFYGDLTVRGTLHADTLSQEQTETVNKWIEVGSQLTNADGHAPIRIKTPGAYTGDLFQLGKDNTVFARFDNDGYLDLLDGDLYGARTVELIATGLGTFNARGGTLTNARSWETPQGEDEALWYVPLAVSDVAAHAMRLRMGTTNILSVTGTGTGAGGVGSIAFDWQTGTHYYNGGSIRDAKLGTDLDAEGFKLTDAGGAVFRTLAKLDWPTTRIGEWATGAIIAQARGAATRTTYLDIIPKGAPSGTQSAIYLWNLDPTISGQESLQEAVYLAALGTVYELGVTKAGATTSLKPLRVRLGSSDMLTLDPSDLSTNLHARSVKNLVLGTNADAGAFAWTNVDSIRGRVNAPLYLAAYYTTLDVPGVVLQTIDRNGAQLDRLRLYTAESAASDTADAEWISMRHYGFQLGAALQGNRFDLANVGHVTLDKGTDGIPTLGFLENGAWRGALWYDSPNSELVLSVWNNTGVEVEALRFKGETSSPYADWNVPLRNVVLGTAMNAAANQLTNVGSILLAQYAILQTRGAIMGRDATSVVITRTNDKISQIVDDGATTTITRDLNGRISQIVTSMGTDKPLETLAITRNGTTNKIDSIARSVSGIG